MSRQKLAARPIVGQIVGTTFGILALIGLATSASAQLTPWDSNNEIMVDLSVLSDNGVGPMPSGPVALPSLTGDLLDPPSRMPVSRLLTSKPPVGGFAAQPSLPEVVLKRPGSRPTPKATAKRAPRKPVSRAPKMAMKTPPPKPSLPVSKPATKLAPAPKPVPKAVVEKAPAPVAKAVSAPPPPPVVAKAAPPRPKVAQPTAPKAAPKPAPAAQVASLPKDAGSNLIFSAGQATLSATASKSLDDIAAKLNAAPNSRMQLLAYAGEPNLSPSKARRLSLSRALAVRSYLIKKGVRSTRIDVRALGNKVPAGAPNRVDLKVIGN